MSGGNTSSNTDIMANDHLPGACFGIEATKQIYSFEEGKPHASHFLYGLGDGDDRLETSPFQGSDNQEMYRITHEHLEEKKGMLENIATDGKRLEYMSRHLAPRAAAYERTGMAHVKDEDEKHRYVRQHDVELRPARMISFCVSSKSRSPGWGHLTSAADADTAL